jgi:hypothetical protein
VNIESAIVLSVRDLTVHPQVGPLAPNQRRPVR